MTRSTILAFVFLVASLPARAGSITITYKNTAGTVTETATSTISDADASTYSAWVTSYFPGNPTGQAAWNAWSDSVFAQLAAQVQEWQGRTAAQAIVPITVTPAQ
jgi:hypothetical protein